MHPPAIIQSLNKHHPKSRAIELPRMSKFLGFEAFGSLWDGLALRKLPEGRHVGRTPDGRVSWSNGWHLYPKKDPCMVYLQYVWLIFMVNVGKYASIMDGMGNEGLINRTRIGMNGALQVLFTWALLRDNSF